MAFTVEIDRLQCYRTLAAETKVNEKIPDEVVVLPSGKV